jgi:solute carrier family 25 (mitochondrial S-adenosylmethionine transporter), member 26
MVRMIYTEKGIKGFAAGIGPRIMWISIGGSIFLGVYDLAKRTLDEGVVI